MPQARSASTTPCHHKGRAALTNAEYGTAYMAFPVVLIWLAVHTCWQTTAMREIFSTRSPEVSKRVFSWAGFIFLGRGMMPQDDVGPRR